MTEPDSTGYQDSPDTIDPGPTPEGSPTESTLTTDDDAQKDDGIVRPGNEPD